MKQLQYNDEFEIDQLSSQFSDRVLQYFRSIHSPLVSSEFSRSDRKAIETKRRFRSFGIACIVLGLLALLFAALEPIILLPLKKQGQIDGTLLVLVAFVAASLGIATAFVGFSGIGARGRKEKWMSFRLRTELIRHWTWSNYLEFHGEYLECSDLVESSENSKERFKNWLREIDSNRGFLTNFVSEPRSLGWVASARGTESSDEPQFFAFYRERRIVRQLTYAEYLASDSGKFFTHAKVQLRILGKLEALFGIAIVFAHLLIVLGVLAGIPSLLGPLTHLLVVFSALGLLAVKAVESGLQPHASIHRLNNYRRQLLGLLSEFDRARSSKTKFKVALAIESEAQIETSEFVDQVGNARFIL